MKRGLGLVCLLLAAGFGLAWLQCQPSPAGPRSPAPATGATRAQAEPLLSVPASQARASEPRSAPAVLEAARAAVESAQELPPAEESPLPVEPIEAGACTLELGLFETSTADPVCGGIELWRLALPGTPVWVAGDQLQAQVDLENGRARFEHLPSGRYRVGVHQRRLGAEDPPAFEVEGPLTRVELRVELPRRFRVLLDVRNESGLPLDAAQVHRPTDSISIAAPAWSQPRRPRAGGETVVEAVEWNSGTRRELAVAAGQGFDLGEFQEATPRSGASRHILLEFPGRSSVRCPILASEDDPARRIAISVPIEAIAERVRTQDGVPLRREQIVIEAVCTAVERGTQGDAQDWRRISVAVSVRAAGYQPLRFDLSPANWPPSECVLVR